MSQQPSRSPAADRLWAHLPGWYRRRDQEAEGLLRQLVEVLGIGLDAARNDVLRLLDDLFVDTCAPELIPLIGDLVGVTVDPDLPLARRRYQVKYALHWRRRRGTADQLEALGWQHTGFRTRVEDTATPAATCAVACTSVCCAHIRVRFDVAWPVTQSRCLLARAGRGRLLAVDPGAPVGLRRGDGTPIYRTDDPRVLVGPGRDIEIERVGPGGVASGCVDIRFADLTQPMEGTAAPPPGTVLLDPERGLLLAGDIPACDAGIAARIGYRLICWRPHRAERMQGRPGRHAGDIFTFDPNGSCTWLTDEEGNRLLLYRECIDQPPAPPASDQRILIARHDRGQEVQFPFVLLAPGQPLNTEPLHVMPELCTPGGALDYELMHLGTPLDRAGLARLFGITGAWGWDLASRFELVHELGTGPLREDTVEIDLRRGWFRATRAPAQVHFHRYYDIARLRRRGTEVMREAMPLGRTATIWFRDTAPGRDIVVPAGEALPGDEEEPS